MCSNSDLDKFESDIRASLVGDLSRRSSILVSKETPEILRKVGLKNLPILFSQRHLKNALRNGSNPHWHNLTLSLILEIPSLIEDPALIMDSLMNGDSIIITFDRINSNKLPIIAVIRPNGECSYDFQTVDTNYLLSVYGRNNFLNYLERSLEEDFVLYANKEKIQSLSSFAELQLLGKFSEDFEFDKIIHQSAVFDDDE